MSWVVRHAGRYMISNSGVYGRRLGASGACRAAGSRSRAPAPARGRARQRAVVHLADRVRVALVDAATRTGDRPLLEVDDLEVRLKNVRGVDGLSMHIAKGETLGLVGESGSGKSTTDRAALQLVPTAAGSIRLDGTDLATADAAARRNLRRRAQMMFQDQFGSLNQRMQVGDIIVAEPLEIHRIGDQAARRRLVDELLSVAGLPANAALRFPHGAARGDPRPRRSARRLPFPHPLPCARQRCSEEAPRLEPSGGFRARPDAAAFWSRDQPRLPACLQAARRPWRCCTTTCCCSTADLDLARVKRGGADARCVRGDAFATSGGVQQINIPAPTQSAA